MDSKFAKKLVAKTRDDYNRISDHFSSTRQFIWPEIANALDKIKIKKKSNVLDLGCGNGRFAKYFLDKEINYYGYDISEELIKIAQKNNPKGCFSSGDLLKTPYRNNTFDLLISIATLHHIPSSEMREQALKEVKRVLKSDGIAVISIWYFWHQPKYLKSIIKTGAKKILGQSGLDFGDFMMPWKDEKQKTQAERYMHSWRKKELKRSLLRNGFVQVSFIENKKSNNLVVVVK